METKRGIAVSPGICIGEAVVLGQEDLRIRRRSIRKAMVKGEIERLHRAVEQTVAEMDEEISRLGDELKLTKQILESHRDMIADASVRAEIAERIRMKLKSAEDGPALVFGG